MSASPATPSSHREGSSGEPSELGGTASVNRERGSVCAQNRPGGTSRRIGKALYQVGPYVGQLFRPYKERPVAPPHALHTRTTASRTEPSGAQATREPRVGAMRTPSTLTFVQPTASLATASAAGTTRTQASFWGRLGTPTSSSFPPSTTAREGSHSGRSEVVASHPSWHWVREGVLIVAAVVLLAEGITIALIYSMSFVGDYAVTITTNTMGEFWFEFPVVIASVPLGLFALYATIGRLKVRLDERVVGPVGEGGPSRNAGGFSYVNGPTHDYPGYLTARVDAPGRERELPPPAFGRAG